MVVTVVKTQEVVELIHQGFDIVIVQFNDGKQACLSCSEVGIKHRTRPKYFKY